MFETVLFEVWYVLCSSSGSSIIEMLLLVTMYSVVVMVVLCLVGHYFRKFQHENLVKLYGVCTGQGPIYIVTELMVNGKRRGTCMWVRANVNCKRRGMWVRANVNCKKRVCGSELKVNGKRRGMWVKKWTETKLELCTYIADVNNQLTEYQ